MDGDVRRRAACDRCHTQKLRCPRRPGVDVCDRCIKARTSCVFSPFRQKKEPDIEQDGMKTTANPQVSVINNVGNEVGRNIESATIVHRSKRKRTPSQPKILFPDLDLTLDSSSSEACQTITETADLDWMSTVPSLLQDFEIDPTFISIDFENQDWYPPLEFSPPLYMTPSEQSQKINNTFQLRSPIGTGRPQDIASSQPILEANVAPPRSSSINYGLLSPGLRRDLQKRHNPSPESLIRQLSELSIGLYEHSKTIPPLSIYDGIPPHAVVQRVKDYKQYNLDETFHLTQDLIDIYPSFISTFLVRDSTGSATQELSEWRRYIVSEDYISREVRPPLAPSLSNSHVVDHASILLILSCHLRLIDIYEELFKHMEMCMAHNGIAFTPEQATYVPPAMKIGSYVPPPSAAVPMQMLLLMQLASQLAEYAGDLASSLRGSPNGHGEGSLGEPAVEGSKDGKFALSLLTADTVKGRASSMAQQLNAVRIKMLQEGFLA